MTSLFPNKPSISCFLKLVIEHECHQLWLHWSKFKCLKYCILRGIFTLVLCCPLLPSSSVDKFNAGQIPVFQIISLKHNFAWANPRRGGSACKWRRAKVTHGVNNPVNSIWIQHDYIPNSIKLKCERKILGGYGKHKVCKTIHNFSKFQTILAIANSYLADIRYVSLVCLSNY